MEGFEALCCVAGNIAKSRIRKRGSYPSIYRIDWLPRRTMGPTSSDLSGPGQGRLKRSAFDQRNNANGAMSMVQLRNM